MSGARRALRRRILGPAVPALLFMCALAWAPAALAADGGISGTVVNGTTGDSVPGIEVTLHVFANQSEVGSRTTTTDRDGAFSFSALGADATAYVVSASYQDVDYRTKLLTLERRTDLTLKVYEPTASPRDVSQTNWVVWIDREGNGIAVQHDIEWVNSGKTAYVGSEPLSDGERVVTQVPLAPGAANFQYLGTFLETPGFVRGATFLHPQPIAPGRSSATLRYTTGSLSELTFPVSLPTDNFSLYIPADITVVSDKLSPAGQAQDRGIPYNVFAATHLAAGDTIEVTLSGLRGRGISSFALVLVGVAALAAVGAFGVWRLTRSGARTPAGRRRARATPARSAGPGRRPSPSASRSNGRRPRAPRTVRSQTGDAAGDPGGNGEPGTAEDQASLLIEEIAALDLAFERGFLDQRTYQSLRTATKDRLLRLRSANAGERPAR